MNPEDFWYPYYPTRFRRATMHLTNEQRQIYRDLIDHYMETGEPIPDSDVAIANITHSSTDAIAIARPFFMPFFRKEKGMLFHEFCDARLREQKDRSEKRSNAGKNGAEKRWKKQLVNSKCHIKGMAEQMPNDAKGQDKTITPISPLEASITFEEFWQAFPKKTRRGFALPAYQKALTITTHAVIMAALKKQLSALAVQKYPDADPTKWLQGECWADVLPPPAKPQDNFAGF